MYPVLELAKYIVSKCIKDKCQVSIFVWHAVQGSAVCLSRNSNAESILSGNLCKNEGDGGLANSANFSFRVCV